MHWLFDSSFCFSAQVGSICSSSYYRIRNFARIKVKVSNYLSTLVEKSIAYRGTHVGAFNLEFWSQISRKSFHLMKPSICLDLLQLQLQMYCLVVGLTIVTQSKVAFPNIIWNDWTLFSIPFVPLFSGHLTFLESICLLILGHGIGFL